MINIKERLSAMSTAKADFESRYTRNDSIYYAFMVDDGNMHFPEGKAYVDTVVSEIVGNFDGSVEFEPTIEASNHDKEHLYPLFTKIYNQENEKVTVAANRKKAIKNAARYGMGVVYEGYLQNKDGFNGLVTESVDPRDFFYDENAIQFYDPFGVNGADDCIRVRYYTKGSFESTFDDEVFDQEAVQRIIDNNHRESTRSRRVRSKADEGDVKQLFKVLEYWSHDELKMECDGVCIYDGENPYGKLPFVIYTLENDNQQIPPSLLEQMAPMLTMEDLMLNLLYTQEKWNVPVTFAHESTGLIEGTELEPGIVNTLTGDSNINQSLQVFRQGGASQGLYSFLQLMEDRKRNIAKIDTRALRDRPNELATQSKIKQITQSKEIQEKINNMMIEAESYRALLRANNIIRFVFNTDLDVFVRNTSQSGKTVRDDKGSNALMHIDPEDWENFKYNIVVKQQVLGELEKERARSQMIDFLNSYIQFLSIPTLTEEQRAEITAKVPVVGLFEKIADTFPEIDLSDIMTKDGTKSVEDQIEDMRKGGAPIDAKDVAEYSLSRIKRDDADKQKYAKNIFQAMNAELAE